MCQFLTFQESPLIARAIMVEAYDSNCTQRKNESEVDSASKSKRMFVVACIRWHAVRMGCLLLYLSFKNCLLVRSKNSWQNAIILLSLFILISILLTFNFGRVQYSCFLLSPRIIKHPHIAPCCFSQPIRGKSFDHICSSLNRCCRVIDVSKPQLGSNQVDWLCAAMNWFTIIFSMQLNTHGCPSHGCFTYPWSWKANQTVIIQWSNGCKELQQSPKILMHTSISKRITPIHFSHQ